MNHFDEPGHKVGPQPAILFVEDQKSPVFGLVERREGEHSQANTQDVGDRASLTAENVFLFAVAFDPKLDGCRARLNSAFARKAIG